MELIYCADGNKRFADIAITQGFRYGAQLPNTIYHPVHFVDQDWRAPNRERYMAALAEHRPALATVLDWEREDQLDEVLSWAEEAARHVTEAVVIIPKVHSGIARLPREVGGKQVRLGYSVPTKFAGTEVMQFEFQGWPVHLLGGGPPAQMKLARYLDVQSADGNYTAKLALQFAKYYSEGAWVQIQGVERGNDAPYRAFTLSCINVRNAWLGLRVGIRYATESDIPAVQRIARQHDAVLGRVMLPALKTSVAKRELFVAVKGAQVVGFCNWHRRRDGWSTVYEIAAHRDYQGHGVGRALLNAIPRPVRLKVTQDNTRANGFYAQYGMARVAEEVGRKRPLNVYELVTP